MAPRSLLCALLRLGLGLPSPSFRQDALFTKALAARDEKYKRITEWKDFVPALNENCIVLTPFCNEMEWEETVKTKSREVT
jgi:prolyl-tRNA synthetase